MKTVEPKTRTALPRTDEGPDHKIVPPLATVKGHVLQVAKKKGQSDGDDGFAPSNVRVVADGKPCHSKAKSPSLSAFVSPAFIGLRCILCFVLCSSSVSNFVSGVALSCCLFAWFPNPSHALL
jgi:hypothetical protein